MRKLYFFHYCVIVFVLGFKIEAWAQVSLPTDYFRSSKSGAWDAANTWESSPDGTNNWVPSATVPTSDASIINIRSSHSITISNNIVVDQLIISTGGILDVATVPLSILTIHNGQGHDIVVENGGVFKHNIAANSSLPSFASSATLEIQGGGILEAANNNGTPSNYANTASPIATNMIWNDGAIFNWNIGFNPAEGVTYFPATSAVPIFRVSQPVTIGGSTNTVINGLLEANANVSFQGSGSKTFRDGITGTGKVGVTAVTGGQFVINGTAAILGGTGILELNNSGLLINSSTIVTLTSDKTINNYSSGTGSITDEGTLVLDKYVISGNSKIKIDGTVKTANNYGLLGGSNTSFATASGFIVNTLGIPSTIEYNDLGNQVVTPLTYNNLIISGSGTKTAGSGADVFVSGVLNIIAGSTFSLNGSNHLKLNSGGTLNINADAIFDNGGESQVSGGGSPTINIYGTFITRDAQGFTGLNTSIPGIVPNIFSGSTIEYGKAGDQAVTSRDDYRNITFSGSGIKTIPTCSPKGTVTIKDDKVIADASNKTFGDSTTNLAMTDGRFKVGGTGTKPDIAGTYTLTGGVIEFTNSGLTKQTIRSPRTYLNIEVSGSNVGNSKGITTLAAGGSFTVKTGGSFDNSGYRIDGIEGNQTVTLEAGATFKTEVKGGFSGNDSAALKNIETLSINPKSTIIYTRAGYQTISPLTAYPKLILTGSGTKTVAAGILIIAAAADSVIIDTSVVFKVNSGAKVDFQGSAVLVRSGADGTGIIGEISDGPSALLNATNIIVERFIPARRSFRFLSPSVTTTSNLKDNWMEGAVNPNTTTRVDPNPGYGTNITGRGGTANGFDPTITNNPSLFTFNSSTQNWDSVSNTNSTLSAGSAYRLMVRGNRSIDMTKTDNNPAPTNTILRAKGKLFTGTFSPALSTVNNGYTFIGNPYVAPVDFKKMWTASKTNNVGSTYYVWDPRLGSRGAYVIYNATQDKNNNAESEVDKNIQSGQAFFLQTKGSSPYIEFLESYKSTGITNVFRNPSITPELSVQLLLSLNAGLENNADGVVTTFDDNFTTAIGNDDSYKFTNLDENLSIDRNGTQLSMEGRPSITANDTIPLKIWQLRQNNYYLRLTASNFSPEISAFLKDSYLHKETPVDLSSESLVSFSVDASLPASFAPDRFSIVFKTGNALPVTQVVVKAYQKEGGIQVNWTAEAEIDIDYYELEKSADGSNFEKLAAMPAKGNNAVAQTYNWFDVKANLGNNFYRIKIVEKSGEVKYSSITNVNTISGNPRITISPNPVRGNVITLQLRDIEKGKYSIAIFNNIGQKVYTGTMNYSGLSATNIILLNKSIPKGIYRFLISRKDKTVTESIVFE